MALNPPIEALPIQETDRDGHLQRYLSGLPDFGSWQDQGEGPGAGTTKTGMDVIQDREVEAAERRNERKIRRRKKAAILKPKLQPDPPEELDQEWWDNHRAQKQGLLRDKEVEVLRDRDMEAERGEMIMEKKENRRLQQRIPKAKGRGKKGIPGIEIIEAYKPMTTALGPRMTMKPETKKGMFANGISSTPGVINLIESTRTNNPRVPSSQSTPGRLTMESPERDWRDQWRRNPSQSQSQVRPRVNDKLPESGYTNSTGWPSTLPSSDGPSKPSRQPVPGGSIAGRQLVSRSVRSSGQDLARYIYRHPPLLPLESRRNSEEEGPQIPIDPTYQSRSYPIPHDPASHRTSTHVLDPHHHHNLQEPTSEDHRNIHMNQGPFPQDLRPHQPHTQMYQEHNSYPQTYSPLLPHHSHLYPHPLPFSSSYLHPKHHAPSHDYIPQTPIFRDQDTHSNSRMHMPPPFSTPGPSRPTNDLQHPQFHTQADQRESIDYRAHGEYQDRHPYRPIEDIEREALNGFWKSSRQPGSNGMINDPHGMDIGRDFDRPPISDQYEPPANHPAPPSLYNDPLGHLFVPEHEHHHQDPMNPYRHQQQLHFPDNNNPFPPQVYQTPQIQHQPHHNGSERRYQTPIPTSNHYQPDHYGPVLGNICENDRGVLDQEEEIMEFGASTDEWKLLWSSRKASK